MRLFRSPSETQLQFHCWCVFFLHGDNLVVETEPEASRKEKQEKNQHENNEERRQEGRGVTAENEKKVVGKSEEGK